MERRFLPIDECPVKLETRADGEAPKIVGRAAVFYDGTPDTEFELWPAIMDGDRVVSPAMIERIMPKAFNKALKEKQDVRGLFNHDPNLVLGRTSSRTLKLEKSLRGLDYEIDPGKTTVAADVMEHIRRGDVTGSSFGFEVLDQKFHYDEERQADIREIRSVNLFDISPVTFPAYTSTSSVVRSDSDLVEVRSAHKVWREEVAEQRAQAKEREERLEELKARRDLVSRDVA